MRAAISAPQWWCALAASEVTRTAMLVPALIAGFSRLRRRVGAPALAAAAAITLVAFPPAESLAQTSSGNAATGTSDLLQPSLQGNAATPQRFRKPGQKRPSAEEPPPTNTFAPSRIGATPRYGSPNGLGAADTGFDSLKVPRSKRKKPLPPPPLRQIVPQPPETTFTPVPTYNPAAPALAAPQQMRPPPPEVYPLRAALRVGATLPPPPLPLQEVPVNNPPPEIHPLGAANRPGSTLNPPGPEFYTYDVRTYLPDLLNINPPPPNLQPPNTFLLGQRPQRLLPILAEPDPYAALGIRAGSFILLPSLDFSGAASTNPEHVPGGPPAAYVVAAPELIVRSDWERHSLTADIAGSWTQFTQDLVPSLNVPYMNSRVDGRIDVTRDTAINLQLRGIINTDNPGSPNTGVGVAQLPINFDVGQTVGITQQFNRLSVSVKGAFDRTTYNPSLLTDGEY
jgi:Putative beta-barrel porin 2